MNGQTNTGACLCALLGAAGAVAELQSPPHRSWPLDDRGFEAKELAPAPTRGWYSDDLANGRLLAEADEDVRAEGRRSLRVELVHPRGPGDGLSSVSQVVGVPGERDGRAAGELERELRFSIKLRSQHAPKVLLEFYTWDERHRAQAFARETVRLKDRTWTEVAVPLTVPEGHERFGVFVYLPGEAGSRFWLDDAALVAR